MSKIDDGGPAYPACNEANVNNTMGMTLRDHFAALAMQGLVARYGTPEGTAHAAIPRRAYLIADSMLVARAKGGDADG